MCLDLSKAMAELGRWVLGMGETVGVNGIADGSHAVIIACWDVA